MLNPGDILENRYRIVRVLGGGGMEQVYMAEDTRLADKLCAVKELLPDPPCHPRGAGAGGGAVPPGGGHPGPSLKGRR